jgi:hypothetical protein
LKILPKATESGLLQVIDSIVCKPNRTTFLYNVIIRFGKDLIASPIGRVHRYMGYVLLLPRAARGLLSRWLPPHRFRRRWATHYLRPNVRRVAQFLGLARQRSHHTAFQLSRPEGGRPVVCLRDWLEGGARGRPCAARGAGSDAFVPA